MTATSDMHEQLQRLQSGTLHDPHTFLGMHLLSTDAPGEGLVVRAYMPGVTGAAVIEPGSGSPVPMERLRDSDLFVAELPRRSKPFPYRLQFSSGEHSWEEDDPYRFPPTLGEQDLYYFGEGTHKRIYDILGAHRRTVEGVEGVSFSVWAPAARGVSVVGDFNYWNSRVHQMRVLGSSGVWELFVPGVQLGAHYKFSIRAADGSEQEKADPYAFQSELRPRTASIVADVHAYEWQDDEWMADRRSRDPYSSPMSIYEVHLGSWRRHADGSWLSYRELAEELAPYVRGMGYTHVELLPVMEHPYDGSWGYQVTGFYAPTSRLGSLQDFQYFVDRMHREGIGVLVDWVPAHFAVDAYALHRFDGTFLYEHQDPRARFHPDWGTYIFNYARHEVRNFLYANALYWINEYHLDGLRVDAVSSMLYLDYSRKAGEWTPNKYGGRENLEAIDLLRSVNEAVYGEGTGAITIAEESTAWPGVSRPVYAQGLGFGFKWNMGWMHDTLSYFRQDPVHRKYHQGVLTFSMVYAFSENFVLSLSHDEVVHGKGSLINKMPGDEWQKFANLRLLHAYMFAQPGKKLLFMGGEFGQWREWSHERELDWGATSYAPHVGVQRVVHDLNELHRAEPALHQLDTSAEGFEWLDFGDAANSVVSFVRRGRDASDYIVCVFNFTPVPRFAYRIPVPEPVFFREVLNTDSNYYGGSGVGNMGAARGEEYQHLGNRYSAALALPPLGALLLKPER